MRARARSAAETADRILDATVELFVEMPCSQITLATLASRAGVTVQTVIRRFGVFGPHLSDLAGVDRDRRPAQLVAVCDVYTWKLLRRDAGLSRRQVTIALLEMLEPLAGRS
jgi:AraC-like DNA-binding protein